MGVAAEAKAKETERRGDRRNRRQAHTGAKLPDPFSGVWIWNLVHFLTIVHPIDVD
jgi:hypothetical protein